MRVMVIGKATKATEAQNSPLDVEGAAEMFEAMEKYTEELRSMDEAVEWAKRFPNPMLGPSEVEIRPLWEPENFNPEIVAQVNAGREKIAEGGSEIPSGHATR